MENSYFHCYYGRSHWAITDIIVNALGSTKEMFGIVSSIRVVNDTIVS